MLDINAYSKEELEELLKNKKMDIEIIEEKIGDIKKAKESFKSRISIISNSTTAGLDDKDISEATKKIKVHQILDFLRDNYDFKPTDLSVFMKISEVSNKSLAAMAIGIKRLSGDQKSIS